MFGLRLLMRSGWQGGPRAAELPADEQATWTGYRLSLGQNADINGSNAALAVVQAHDPVDHSFRVYTPLNVPSLDQKPCSPMFV
jgi:hypothetical protein